MKGFTPAEIAFLESQTIGRLATLGRSGDIHVVPVRFRYNPDLDCIDVTGRFLGASKKYRDVLATGRAAFVVDDAGGAWNIRGVEVRGRADAIGEGGDRITPGVDPEFIRVTPSRIVSWGIDAHPYQPRGRTITAARRKQRPQSE